MRSVGGAGPTWTKSAKNMVFGPPPGLESNPANGVPFKVTLLNTPHLLRKAARFARARFARAFYLVKSKQLQNFPRSPAPPLHTVFWRSFLGFLANLQKKFGGLVEKCGFLRLVVL